MKQIHRNLYQRAKGSYVIRRTINGQRRVITLHGIATEEGAKHCAVLCDMAIAEGRVEEFVSRFAKTCTPTVAEAVQKWVQYSTMIKKNKPKVIVAKERSASSVIPFISNMLGSISLPQLEAWVAHRNSQVNETTVFDDVTRIKQFFRYCLDQDWINKSPAARLRCPKPSRKTKDSGHLVMRDTLDNLQLSPAMSNMVHVMWLTGLRISEVYRIQPEDVHESELHIRCDTENRTKSARGRTVNVSASCHARLRLLTMSQLPAEHLVRKALKEESRRLGVSPAITPHAFRHTRASLWAAEGKSLVQIQHWLGHSDQRTTQGYIHPLPGQLRENVA